MTRGCKLIAKKPFLHWSLRQSFNTYIAKVKAQNVFFWPLDDIEVVDWTTTNQFAWLWFFEDIHHSPILKLAIKKAIQKSPKVEFVKQVVSRWFKQWIKSVCWVCVFTKKGTLLTSFHIHSFVVFHTDLQKNTIVTCLLTSPNPLFIKYARLIASAYAIDTILQCVIVIHRHHQWIYWRWIHPKSKLSWWLWGNRIWCNPIDSRWGAKFIYIKDRHANTYVSVWVLFPVGKIWSSHSTIKFRFDKQ